MSLELVIPPCICLPADVLHPPPLDKALRIHIEGPLVAIQRLFPHVAWNMKLSSRMPLQPAAVKLAELTFRKLYRRDACPELVGDMVIRGESPGWVTDDEKPYTRFDYYGVTFDHLVPVHELDPEVLHINIIELEAVDGLYANGEAYANKYLLFAVNAADYVGKKVLAVPRCCQKRRGTTDRFRVNRLVAYKDAGKILGQV